MIEIYTAENFINIRNNLNEDYVIMNDLDFSEFENWTPIPSFSGTLDGQSYTISNLVIDSIDEFNTGLFSSIDFGGRIKNLNIENATITCGLYGGILAGRVSGDDDTTNTDDVVIENCKLSNIIVNTNGNYVGGMAGIVEGGVEIIDCTISNLAFFNIAGISGYGGIVGTAEEYILIENCTVLQSTINATTSTSYAGGIVGYAKNEVTIRKCFVDIEIGRPWNSIGGIVGSAREVLVEKCSSEGLLDCSGTDAGGIVGYTRDVEIKNCVSTCKLIGYSNMGGVSGYNRAVIENCYYNGTININDSGESSIGYVHGIAGYQHDYGEIISSYYNRDKNLELEDNLSAARKAAEMKREDTYEGWDFDNIWGIDERINDGYPVLRALFDIPAPVKPSRILYFLENPRVSIQPSSANVVTVISPTAEYTARGNGISDDKVIERLVEIKEGDYNVCRIVAEELLSRWSREQKSISGLVWQCQGLNFRKKAKVYVREALIDEDMKVQKLDHNILNQTTKVIAGDIILSDEELLARILDKL